MLKLFSTIYFLFLFTVSLFPQWTMLNPTPTYETSFMGSTAGADKYIVPSQYIHQMVLTTDGGTTFNLIPMNTTSIIRSAFFVNENLGWAAGASSALFKTTDGGFTWNLVPAIDSTKYDIFFINENTGWSAGFNGFVMKTTDGGSSWLSKSVTSVSTRTLYGVHATDINNVYIAGSSSTLYKSTDGGDSWTLWTSPFSTSTDLKEIKFTSPTTGFVIGASTRIAKTTNAGAAWTQVNTGGANQLWSLSFNSTGNIGVACGANGTVLRTTNNGDSWSLIGGFPDQILYSVRFAADNIVYLSGAYGYFFKSTDAGATWTELSTHAFTSTINDVSFADNSTGYICGLNGFVAKSTDGGKHWTQQTSGVVREINEIIAPSPNVAIAGCDGGVIIRTTNGGATWDSVLTGITGSNTDILAIDFVNDTLGIIAGYGGTVAITADGGASWSVKGAVPSGNPWDMDMVDENVGWIAATGEKLIRTTDGGATWELQFTGGGLGTYGISFIDRSNGVAGGTSGKTYYTTNGGINWNPAATPPGKTVWGIHMAPSPVYGSVALTACESGYLYKSTDGGANWTEDPRLTISAFSDVCMTDAAHGWIVGNSGNILSYYEPGNIPVEMNTFTASVTGNNVTLNWMTITEINNKGFAVERFSKEESERTGFDTWQEIGFVEGQGTISEYVSYSFNDKNLPAGEYNYRLKQTDFDGTFKYFTLDQVIEISVPANFNLAQNYPNPFNPSTRILFSIPADEFVNLKIYNSLGEETASLVNSNLKAGYHEIEFNASDLPSGIYYYKINAGNFTSTKKMMLLK